jgi:hypothetical protein
VVAACIALSAGSACTAPNAPWDVRDEDRGRFQRAERECGILTQDASGAEGPIGFDRCMNRRGFERMNRIERLWKT